MPAQIWEYEAVRCGPDLQEVRSRLNYYGDRGFEVLHVQVEGSGAYVVLMGKNTGRPVQEKDDYWLDDVAPPSGESAWP